MIRLGLYPIRVAAADGQQANKYKGKKKQGAEIIGRLRKKQ
jgi:hypothetical protein